MTCNFGVIYSLLRVLVSRREKRKREPLREFRLNNRSVNLIVAPKRPEETKKKKKRKTKRVNGLLTNFYQARTINRHIRIRFSFIFLSLSLSRAGITTRIIYGERENFRFRRVKTTRLKSERHSPKRLRNSRIKRTTITRGVGRDIFLITITITILSGYPKERRSRFGTARCQSCGVKSAK